MHDSPAHEAKSVPFAVSVLAVCLQYHYRICADICCLPCRVQLTLYPRQLYTESCVFGCERNIKNRLQKACVGIDNFCVAPALLRSILSHPILQQVMLSSLFEAGRVPLESADSCGGCVDCKSCFWLVAAIVIQM